MHVVSAVVLALYCYTAVSVNTAIAQQQSCAGFQGSCSECIRGSPDCAWCEDSVYFIREQPAERCNTVPNHNGNKCKKIVNPKSGSDTNKNKKLDSTTNVTPQNLTLHLRRGQPAKINVSIRTPENFPVDLYYLMDLSGSMFKDMQQITSLGRSIATEMSKITKKFRLGFGTFVDKPLAPFVDTQPLLLAHPRMTADGVDTNSIPAFGFRNSLPLDLDTTKFETKVAEQNISGNVDNPEGGFDALLQVAVCHKEIGWERKEDARRLVVFTTDASYHFAGDGLLGGVVTPNDGECHLSAQGEYEASTLMDYPSLGQLRQILLENQVVPIFAITQNQKDIYDVVRRFFGDESFAVAAELEADGSNIVTLIREAYEKIAKTQTISDNTTTGITITYKAICPDGTYQNTRVCNNVKIGEKVTFEVSVTAEECTDKMPDRVHLRTAFGEVALNLEYICDCQCQDLEYHEEHSPHCTYNGSLVCGECECDSGWEGRLCNCKAGTANDVTKCPKSNATGQTCSGRGKCFCGECICGKSTTPGEMFYGDHCQCSNMNCPHDKAGLICGGPKQGKCDCDVCNCYGNWTGPACSCTQEVDGCIQNEVLCSGRGFCQCGKCVCNSTLPFIGTYCDDCPSCSDCSANKACVQCRAFGTGRLGTTECLAQCSDDDIKVNIVEEIPPELKKRCSFTDDDDCTFTFAYQPTTDNRLEVFVEREKVCPEQVHALVVILGVIFGILAVGLALLLIWRLLATIQDRREFAKFEKERQHAKWDTGENPIFKQATTTFQNPTYKRA